MEEQIKNSVPVDILGKIANIRVEKDKIAIDLRKANSRPPQPEPEEVENEPLNGLM